MDQSSRGESLKNRVRELRRRFADAVQAYEENKVQPSIQTSRKVFDETQVLINDITEDYKEAFLDRKYPDHSKDKTFIQSLEKDEKNRPETDQFIEFLTRLDRALRAAETEISRNYPRPSPGLQWTKKNFKNILFGALVVGLTGVIINLWHSHKMKRFGLVGVYYADTSLSKVYKQRKDLQINFNWGLESPLRGWRKDDFSVRWSGYLKVPKEGNYEFSVHSDDGVRLIIDSKTVVDNWTVHRLMVDQGTISLTAGPHAIKVEYFENKRKSIIQLYWKTDSDPRPQLIPASAFAPTIKLAR